MWEGFPPFSRAPRGHCHPPAASTVAVLTLGRGWGWGGTGARGRPEIKPATGRVLALLIMGAAVCMPPAAASNCSPPPHGLGSGVCRGLGL